MMKNNKFFDSASGFYDKMISSDNIIKLRSAVLKKFIKPHFATAVDLGCGTGNDSIALTLNGLKVTAFDPSKGMLEKGKTNAERYKALIRFQKSEIENISGKFKNKFDFAVSLGNTLANIKEIKLHLSFRKIFNVLKREGRLVIQILNYDAVKRENKRIINITRDNDFEYIRFYDFHSNYFNFNILKIGRQKLQYFELITTPLFPHNRSLLVNVIKKSGFKKIKCFGGFNSEKFLKYSSKDLIIVADK
ncbi:class I SAM-dependent methyltransferase [bacterium]|nr:MAG: class I SAM-dependent methyltransferase [bacterium]